MSPTCMMGCRTQPHSELEASVIPSIVASMKRRYCSSVAAAAPSPASCRKLAFPVPSQWGSSKSWPMRRDGKAQARSITL